MKRSRLLSLILAMVLLLSAGCASAPVTPPTDEGNNNTSSADVSAYAAWLADRLGAEADGNDVAHEKGTVTLAVANGDAVMGVDVNGLRNEGYIIRTEGNDTLIVAKSENGVDRAVRKYAAEVEQNDSYFVNHMEGFKIGQILLGGVDITEYKILLPKAADGVTAFIASATMAMETAAGELVKYIELATGVKLPIEYVEGLHDMTDAQIKEKCGNGIVYLSDPTAKGGSSIEGAIEYVNGAAVEVGPGEMGTESYHLTVADGIMKLVGGNQRGCIYGTYDFLENYIGWRFFGNDVEYLYDAEKLVINDVDEEFTPTFGYRATTFSAANDFNNFPKMKQNCFNTTRYAHTEKWGFGLGSTFYHAHTFSYQVEPDMKGSQPYGDQPCLTDEYTKEVIINSMLSLIYERLNPPFNTRIGYDTVQIGCSMNDNTNFCKCSECMKVVRSTSFTDLYLGFVNDAAEVIEEHYPGMIVNTAIYFVARKPPVETVPRDNVSIYYCLQGCNQHTISDGLCAGYDTTLGTNNIEEKAQLDAWNEICDRIYAWHYSASFFSNLGPCPNLYEIYDDVTYVASLGVYGFYAEGDSAVNNNFESLKSYLFCKLMYNADITREEFYAMIDEYVTIVYGEESAPYIRQYLDMHQQSGDAIDGCFINNYHYPLDMMDKTYFRENYKTMCDLFDKAVRYAADSEIEQKINDLRLHMELIGLSATYDTDYVNGTAESRAEYEASYKWLVDNYSEFWTRTYLEMYPEHNPDNPMTNPIDRVNTKAPDNYEITKNPIKLFIPDSSMTGLSKEGRA